MKKRIFAFLMSCCMLLPTIAACEKKTQEQQPEKKDVICSFESVEEVTTLYGGDIFGKKQYSTNEKYVTDGKRTKKASAGLWKHLAFGFNHRIY